MIQLLKLMKTRTFFFKFNITEALKWGENTLLLLLGGNKLMMHTDQYSILKQTLTTCQILAFSQVIPSFHGIQLQIIYVTDTVSLSN